jgi:hypothetical protein
MTKQLETMNAFVNFLSDHDSEDLVEEWEMKTNQEQSGSDDEDEVSVEQPGSDDEDEFPLKKLTKLAGLAEKIDHREYMCSQMSERNFCRRPKPLCKETVPCNITRSDICDHYRNYSSRYMPENAEMELEPLHLDLVYNKRGMSLSDYVVMALTECGVDTNFNRYQAMLYLAEVLPYIIGPSWYDHRPATGYLGMDTTECWSVYSESVVPGFQNHWKHVHYEFFASTSFLINTHCNCGLLSTPSEKYPASMSLEKAAMNGVFRCEIGLVLLGDSTLGRLINDYWFRPFQEPVHLKWMTRVLEAYEARRRKDYRRMTFPPEDDMW